MTHGVSIFFSEASHGGCRYFQRESESLSYFPSFIPKWTCRTREQMPKLLTCINILWNHFNLKINFVSSAVLSDISLRTAFWFYNEGCPQRYSPAQADKDKIFQPGRSYFRITDTVFLLNACGFTRHAFMYSSALLIANRRRCTYWFMRIILSTL